MAFVSRILLKVIIIMVMLINLVRTQAIQFRSGPVNTTVIVGQNLTLICQFSEPVDGDFNILWKKITEDIGRCQKGYDCDNFDASRISLKESNRMRFELQVTNVSLADSGSYECGVENRSSNVLEYSRMKAAVVSVVPESTITNPSCSVEISESVVNGRQMNMTGMFTHLTCTWPRSYAGALGEVFVPYLSSVQNPISPGQFDSVGNISSIIMETRLLSSVEDSQCLMMMPGLQSKRSCNFLRPLSPNVVRIAEDETAEFTCNSENRKALSWFAIINNTVIDMPLWMTLDSERIIMRYIPIKYNNLTVICATRNGNGQLILSGVGKLFVNRRTMLAHSNSSSSQPNDNQRILRTHPFTTPTAEPKDLAETTKDKNTTATSAKHYVTPVAINSNTELQFDAFPSWMKYLIYYCSIASSLALALSVLMVAYFCIVRRRRKTAPQEDVEQPPQIAKVVAIPSHTIADYATIDSSELKLKRQIADNTVDTRERKDSFRYFQPNRILPLPKSKLEVATTSNGYATPSIPQRRTQSEYRQNNCDDPTYFDTSNSRHLWRNMSLQQPLSYGAGIMEFPKSTAIDEESTIDSRTSVLKKEGQDEVFYFPLDKICTGDNQLGEIDNKTIKSSMSEETTLGRHDNPYFTLEQKANGDDLTANRENNNCQTVTKITNNNESSCGADYDNFRSQRIPYVRENSTTDHYEKLKCNSKC